MRFDSLLDSLFALGSLWSVPPSPQVCANLPTALPDMVHDVAWAPRSQGQVEVTAFVRVNVIPMDSERVLTDQTVLVEDGRITAVGPAGQVRVPAGAVRVEGQGKYLIPGLVDMHGHLFGSTSMRDGVTAFRVFGGVTIGQAAEFRARIEASHPYHYFAGDIREFVRPGLRLDEVATAYKAVGYHFVDIPSDYYPDLAVGVGRMVLPGRLTLSEARERQLKIYARLDSLLAVARLAGLTVGTHADPWAGIATPDQMMLRFSYYAGGSVEHVYSFMKGVQEYFQAPVQARNDAVLDTVPNLQAIAAAVQRAGIWITPTLGCHESLGLSRVARQIVQALHQAGVKLLLGPDDGADVYTELVALADAGLTPYQALLTGTRNPAQYFGLLDSVGTVTVGKRADLVLLEGNPLVDIYQTIDPAGVMLRGRWFSREELYPAGQPRDKVYWPRVIKEAFTRASRQLGVRAFERDAFAQPARDALADSLALGGRASVGHQRVVRLVAAQISEYRAQLPSAQQVAFDEKARRWMRECTQKGYVVAISGIQP